MNENEKIENHILQKYQVIKKLGSGAYGHVWKVRSRQNSQIYALKKIFEAFQHATDSQRTFRQISVLKKLNHQNIVKLHQVLESCSKRDIYLVFQFMQTDLCNAIYQNILHKVHQKYIIYQMLLGLSYMHSAQLIHRDLKPSNILLKGDCSLKICDFGLVRFIGKNDVNGNILTEGVATRWYRAPEVLLGSNCYDQTADLWSIGCIIAEMVTHNPLFPGNSTIEQLQKMLQFTGKPSQSDIYSIKCQLADPMISNVQIKTKNKKQYFNSSIDPQCIGLICSLIQFNPEKRISALQALKHPYLKQFYDAKDLKLFEGEITLEISDNVQLHIQEYKAAIYKYFVDKNNDKRKLSSQKNSNPNPTSNSLKKFADIKNHSEDKPTDDSLSKTSSKLNQNQRVNNLYQNTYLTPNYTKEKTQGNILQQLLVNQQHRSRPKNSESPSFNSIISKKVSNMIMQSPHQIKSNIMGDHIRNTIENRKTSISKDKENVSSNLRQNIGVKVYEKYITKNNVRGNFLPGNNQPGGYPLNHTSFAGLKKVGKMNK